MIITIIVIGPLLFGVNYITPYNDHFHILRKGGLYKVGNCFWYIYGALLQQGDKNHLAVVNTLKSNLRFRALCNLNRWNVFAEIR